MASLFNRIKWLTVIIMAMILGSCTSSFQKKHEASQNAENFCKEFFSFQFDKAAKYCANGEDGWLKMYVSNISTKDEENIHNADFSPEINAEDCIINEKDSFGTVTINAKSIYYMYHIGKPGEVLSDGTFKVDMVLERDSVWRVKMVNLLQSEKQNHDGI